MHSRKIVVLNYWDIIKIKDMIGNRHPTKIMMDTALLLDQEMTTSITLDINYGLILFICNHG